MRFIKFSIIFMFVFLFAAPGYGLVVKKGQSIVIGEEDEIDDDLVAFGRTVDIRGMINGDVYAFAQNVKITGDVDGTIFTGAATVDLDVIGVRSVWAAGGTVNISGDIMNNAVLFGGAINVDENGVVGKDLKVYGGEVTVEGEVDGTIKAGADKFIMAGRSGQVTVDAEEVTISSPARISGDLIIRGKKEPTIETGAEISGETKFEEVKESKGEEKAFLAIAPLIAFFIWLAKIILFIAKIIVGIVLIALVKNYLRRIIDTLVTKPWHSLGWGFLGLIVIPVSVAILFIVLIGFPFAFLGIYVYTILLYLSSIIVGLVIGEKIIRLFKTEGEISLYLSLIVGIVVLTFVGLIPVLGFLVKIATVLFGAGAILFGSWTLIQEAKKKEMV